MPHQVSDSAIVSVLVDEDRDALLTVVVDREAALTCIVGKNGDEFGTGDPNPNQLERYIENGAFCAQHFKPSMRYFKHANREYLDWAVTMGFLGDSARLVFQLYAEPMQTFRLAAAGHGDLQPPEEHRRRIATYFDPLPFWYPPFEGAMIDEAAYPILWMDLCRIFQGQIVGNFMGSDNKPIGVHIGYLDGSIEWKPGKDMKVRYRGSANLLW